MTGLYFSCGNKATFTLALSGNNINLGASTVDKTYFYGIRLVNYENTTINILANKITGKNIAESSEICAISLANKSAKSIIIANNVINFSAKTSLAAYGIFNEQANKRCCHRKQSHVELTPIKFNITGDDPSPFGIYVVFSVIIGKNE
jgi:hypothetical protein